MMEPLISQTIKHGGIFPVQCCPSPYHALPAALGIEVPADKKGNISWMLEAIKEKVAEHGATGRIATWPVPVNMMFMQAGTYYAVDWIEGKITSRNDKAKLIEIMESIAGMKVTLSSTPTPIIIICTSRTILYSKHLLCFPCKVATAVATLPFSMLNTGGSICLKNMFWK